MKPSVSASQTAVSGPRTDQSLLHPELRGNHSLSLYELTVDNHGGFVVSKDLSTMPFDFSRYSEFKYGRRDVAEDFGTALATLLVTHLQPLLVTEEQVVIMGTPHKRLPNAAKILATTAVRKLRASGLPVSYTNIYQHRLAEGDYGMLSNIERDRRNNQKKRYLDTEDFTGKHVVVIDDVRITGSIERSIMSMLDEVKTLSVSIVNLVQLDPRIALEQPHLEDKLNHQSVRDLRDLLRLMKQRDRFTLITRAVKFILQSDLGYLAWFLEQLDETSIAELHESIVDEGYDQMSRYHQAFQLVSEVRNNR